jgi:transcriptional regulator with XRE-family HTH domain
MDDKTYPNWASHSDLSLLEVIGRFVKHHRLLQNRSQTEVAKSATISRSTLSLMERGKKVTVSSLIQVLRVLDLLYIMDVFEVKEEISPIEYAKLRKAQRQRAGRSKKTLSNEKEIEW